MKFSYTKNPESDFYKESKFNQKKRKKNLAVGKGGVARVMFFLLFSKESKSEKNCLFLRGLR